MSDNLGKYVILRTSGGAGVLFGRLKSLSQMPGSGLFCAQLEGARQIHHWQQNGQNFTLFELSLRGVVPPATARISDANPETTEVASVCTVYPCLPEAIENLSQARWNFAYSPSA